MFGRTIRDIGWVCPIRIAQWRAVLAEPPGFVVRRAEETHSGVEKDFAEVEKRPVVAIEVSRRRIVVRAAAIAPLAESKTEA